MTKTLTEQWKNGELEFGYYYIDFGIGGVPMLFNGLEFYCERTQKPNAIKTILAPVPSYDHFSQLGKMVEYLQERLEEADKTIKDQEIIIKKLKRRRICDNQKTEARKEHINELIDDIKKLKEELARRGRMINELKMQRKEANELLLAFCNESECQFDHNGYCQEHDSCEGGYKCIQKDLKQHLKKWGVK